MDNPPDNSVVSSSSGDYTADSSSGNSSSSNGGDSSSSQPQDSISSSETPSSSSNGSSSGNDNTTGSSSGNNESSSSNGMIKKTKISGVFQKGPFIAGTAATLNELDNGLNPTGRPYQTLITDDKGTFELRNVELVSPYAHLIANGFYRNEVTGNKSAAPITLQAIVDVADKDNVNVNILTHLEYYRVIDLVDGGMTVKAAKRQAQKEIFAVFGIDSDAFNKDSEDMTVFGTSESDAALLAVSILLLGDLSEADFSQRLMNLSQAIRTSGVWNDDAEKQAITDWAAKANLAGIRNNILAWKLSAEVPEFGKLVYDYWIRNYGLSVCNAEINGNKVQKKDKWFKCQNNAWQYCADKNSCSFDERDGKTYKGVEIGTQIWMAENLNYGGSNGTIGTCYDDDSKNCETYGRLYDWETAIKACPSGWHLPSKEEWEELVDFAGGNSAGLYLKAKNGWSRSPVDGNGLDSYGFMALPGGDLSKGKFNGIGNWSNWWGSTENDDNGAFLLGMSSRSKVDIYTGNEKTNSYYVRCIED